MYKKILLALAVMIISATWVTPSQAAIFRAGDSILIPKNFTATQDVYAASQDLNAQGTFNGDLLTAGMNERITGNVKGSVMSAGMYVDILGNVGRSVRAVGNKVVIGGTVEGDVLVAGAFVQILPEAVIKGDLLATAGSLSIDGKVEGKVKASAGNIFVNGIINGENKFNVQDKLTIGETAHFAKKLDYSSSREAVIHPKAVLEQGSQFIKIETPVHTNQTQAPEISFGIILVGFVAKLLIMLVTALVLMYFFRKQITAIGKDVLDRFAPNLGWGLVWAIVTPIACTILLVTILGSMLGILGFMLYALTLFVSCVLAEIFVGMWLRKLISRSRDWEVDWKTVLLGVIVFQVISSIPVIGWIAAWIFGLAALGGLVGALRSAAK